MHVSLSTSDWYAWADFMPPAPPRLHVTGTVQARTPGWTVSLRRAVPQGFNPRELILDLDARPPVGVTADVITPTPVRYDQEVGGGAYDSVLVRVPGGEAVQLRVERVS